MSRSAASSVFERREARAYASLYPPQRSPDAPGRSRAGGSPGGGGPLDRPRQHPDPGGHDPWPAGNLTGPILVVDDDRAILISVQEILELEGYPVVTATNGTEALRRIEEERPALILLDMRMPGLNGWDVARTLREQRIAVPVLVMTAAQDARRWAAQIGAAGYLAKPFDLDDLLVAVARLLRA